MAAWREIARQDPTAVTVVHVLEGLVDVARAGTGRWAFDPGALGVDMMVGEFPMAGAEILGVGLLDTARETYELRTKPHMQSGWDPVVFLVDPVAWTELGEFPLQLAMGRGARPVESLVRVVGLPPARPFAGTGERCYGPSTWGTLGARVTAKSGADGVLVAGHVAEATGKQVDDNARSLLGTVAECVHPGQVAPQVSSGDVAVVELHAPVGGVAHGTVVASAASRDDLEIHGAKTGVTRSWVRGLSKFWAGPDPASGDWASVVVMRDGTTADGDSGALVLRDGTLDPVGHVVGGVPGVYTLVQELDEQLKWLGGISLR
jgi:hypothetical protein